MRSATEKLTGFPAPVCLTNGFGGSSCGGVLVNPGTLIYATGGAAWQQYRSASTCSPIVSTSPVGILSNCAPTNYFTGTLGPSVISHDITKVGWTIGGGLETRIFSSNWTARAEYRYADFGTANFTDVRTCTGGCPATANPLSVSYDVRLRTHTALFGIAYLFN